MHGLSPQTLTGDHVDIYINAGGQVGLMAENVLILQAPSQTAAGTTAATSENYVLRVPTKEMSRYQLAADSGGMYFALRPQTKAKPAGRAFASGDNVFAGD